MAPGLASVRAGVSQYNGLSRRALHLLYVDGPLAWHGSRRDAQGVTKA